ncbi:MAG: transcription antitermination factor NusB [Phycisphaerales bacterium]|nr:transcription antitermination factor NusB [Phycisphaerales bacterium]
MALPRDIRRLAFQALFQLDARGDGDLEAVKSALDSEGEFAAKDKEKAIELAIAAYQARLIADKAMLELAPTWPAHRQAAVDRAILRLAHYEMTSGRTSPKIAVNEAVELAKRFSTEKSPGFVNALLDKILKKVLAEGKAAELAEPEAGDETGAESGESPAGEEH